MYIQNCAIVRKIFKFYPLKYMNKFFTTLIKIVSIIKYHKLLINWFPYTIHTFTYKICIIYISLEHYVFCVGINWYMFTYVIWKNMDYEIFNIRRNEMNGHASTADITHVHCKCCFTSVFPVFSQCIHKSNLICFIFCLPPIFTFYCNFFLSNF